MSVCRSLCVAVVVSAVAAGTAGLVAGETFFLNEKEDWSNQGLVTNEDGSLGLKGGQWIYSVETFPVDTAAASKLSGEFKKLPGASAKDRFFFAFVNFDKDMKRIEGDSREFRERFRYETGGALHGAGHRDQSQQRRELQERRVPGVSHHGRLSRPAQQEREWQGPGHRVEPTGRRHVAGDCRGPDCGGRPCGDSRSRAPGRMVSVLGRLGRPHSRQLDKIRRPDPGFRTGRSPPQMASGNGLCTAHPVRRRSAKEPFLAFRSVRFEATGGAGSKDSSKEAVVKIPAGAVETNLSLRPTKSGQDLKVHFANGSSRTVRITVFDEKITDQKQEIILPAAGVEIQPFDVRYTLRPSAFGAGKVTPAERVRLWGKEMGYLRQAIPSFHAADKRSG